MLECLLGRDIDVDAIPVQDPLQGGDPGETVVLAGPVKTSEGVTMVGEDGALLSPAEASKRLEEKRNELLAQRERVPVEVLLDRQAGMGGFVR